MRTLWFALLTVGFPVVGSGQMGSPGGGETQAIALHPMDTQIIYAGAARGLCKTTQGGADGWPSTGLEALSPRVVALDPQNPDVLYVGTYQSGVYKTTGRGCILASSQLWTCEPQSARHSRRLRPQRADLRGDPMAGASSRAWTEEQPGTKRIGDWSTRHCAVWCKIQMTLTLFMPARGMACTRPPMARALGARIQAACSISMWRPSQSIRQTPT